MTPDNRKPAEAPDWTTLYRIGGVAALVAAVIFRRNLSAEVSLFSGQIPPTAAGDWLALLHNDALLGLTYLDFFDVINYALVGLLFLALYTALRQVNQSTMRIAVSLGLVGIVLALATNQSVSMLALSSRYAGTSTTEQATYAAAGEVLLASAENVGAYLSLLFVTLAGLIMAGVMLQSAHFSRVTAYLGILGNVLILGYFITVFFAPSLNFLPHAAGAVPLVLWQGLAGWRLLRLGRVRPATGVVLLLVLAGAEIAANVWIMQQFV